MKKAAESLTESGMKKLKGKDRTYCVWDRICPGFGVEVRPAGTLHMVVKTSRDGIRTWNPLGVFGVTAEEMPVLDRGKAVLREDGSPLTKMVILNVDAYRSKATILKGQVKQGDDPKAAIEAKKEAARARKTAITVSALLDRFILEHIGAKVTWQGESFKLEMLRDANGKLIGNKESTAREHIRMIERNIRPALGHMMVKEVGTAEVSTFLFNVRKDHPTLANRLRAVLSKMFSKAELWGLRPAGSNPSKGQDRAPENKKERNLTDQEIFLLGAVMRAAEGAEEKPRGMKRVKGEPWPETPYALAALRLAILAGMRKAEIIGDRYRGMPALTWPDVDLEAGILMVHHKTEGRTGKKRIVHLCTAAKEVLESLPRHLGNPHVIPGEVAGQSLVNLQAVWVRLRDAVTENGKKEKATKKEPAVDLSDVTIHDLRRTFSSVAARMGYPELWIGGLLGHSAGTVTAGYARVNQDPLREAVEAIGGRIAGLLSGEIDPTKEAEEAPKRGQAR